MFSHTIFPTYIYACLSSERNGTKRRGKNSKKKNPLFFKLKKNSGIKAARVAGGVRRGVGEGGRVAGDRQSQIWMLCVLKH
mmetsp:Transcript_93906/g.137123  ORF Transcript_93906/g.137123 Transcript_93906/m.137123 type:complete len:81 (-) Transcript_93906:9-251(-)